MFYFFRDRTVRYEMIRPTGEVSAGVRSFLLRPDFFGVYKGRAEEEEERGGGR